jgi:hypothetical protein
MIIDETKTLTEEEFGVLTEDRPAAAPAETTKEETDIKKIPQRRPPKQGPCKRCGQDKPLNRLMLCYPCWVKTELEKSGWREGMPHPDWCHCEGIKDHQRKSDGN